MAITASLSDKLASSAVFNLNTCVLLSDLNFDCRNEPFWHYKKACDLDSGSTYYMEVINMATGDYKCT